MYGRMVVSYHVWKNGGGKENVGRPGRMQLDWVMVEEHSKRKEEAQLIRVNLTTGHPCLTVLPGLSDKNKEGRHGDNFVTMYGKDSDVIITIK